MTRLWQPRCVQWTSVLVATVVLLGTSSASASMRYECWTFVAGKPDRMTQVVADNKAQAEKLATQKFRQLGVPRFEGVRCR